MCFWCSSAFNRLSEEDLIACADPKGGGEGARTVPPPPLENHKNIGFRSNTGPDHKATNPALNVGPSSFRWRADDDPLIVVF